MYRWTYRVTGWFLTFQMCICLPFACPVETIPGCLVVTKETAVNTSETEPLTFVIYHLHFSESQFGPFTSVGAPKWSSFTTRRGGVM